MASRIVRMLILCKTYPSPSSAYVETSCVAAMEENGSLIRIYPMPFRLVDDNKQFKKWQWVTARVEKSRKDHRAESHKIFVDTIECESSPLSTKHHWKERQEHLKNITCFDTFDGLENARFAENKTLGLLRPANIIALDITPTANKDWTKGEKDKLLQLQQQGDLFDATDHASINTLRKLPHEFHFRYICKAGGRSTEYRHKIVDWEIGALYWNVRRKHGGNWEQPFRDKIERQLPKYDLQFLMGTIHRFPDQWLIVSLIYPPKLQAAEHYQASLFDP